MGEMVTPAPWIFRLVRRSNFNRFYYRFTPAGRTVAAYETWRFGCVLVGRWMEKSQ